MVASVFSFAGVGVGVRGLADGGMSEVEIVFFRALFGVFVLLPWLLKVGRSGLRTKKLGWHGLRSILMCVGMIFWFAAIARLPLAEAVALHFTLPLFLVVYAWIFLREKVLLSRLFSTLIGFLGVLVILRPGFNQLTLATLFVLISAALYAANHAISRYFAQSESPELTTFLMNAMIVVPTGIASFFWWSVPDLADIGWITIMGIFGTTSHLALMRAYGFSEASALAPLDFLRIVFAGLAGYLIFGHISDLWTWVGASIIFCAAYYNTRANTQSVR